MKKLADHLEDSLPFVRRYARALTGDQGMGDDLAFKTLQAIQADRATLEATQNVRVALFKAFHAIWIANDRRIATAKATSHAQDLIASLTPDSREALLLATMEGCTRAEIAFILSVEEDEVADLLRQATRDMQRAGSGEILIIEDESIIAADLTNIVEQVGHRVVGVGRTQAEAVALAKKLTPDLILADIQLADGSSGIDAVRDILEQFGAVPVIFITAFPERLLTGKRPEPAFLIVKPYSNEHVTSAVSQAMFFASTETLDRTSP